MATTVRRGYDPTKDEIELFTDEVQNTEDYHYYKQMAKTYNKTLKIIPRPAKPPDNALVVTAEELRSHANYTRLKAKAEREGKQLWIKQG